MKWSGILEIILAVLIIIEINIEAKKKRSNIAPLVLFVSSKFLA